MCLPTTSRASFNHNINFALRLQTKNLIVHDHGVYYKSQSLSLPPCFFFSVSYPSGFVYILDFGTNIAGNIGVQGGRRRGLSLVATKRLRQEPKCVFLGQVRARKFSMGCSDRPVAFVLRRWRASTNTACGLR